MKNKLGYFGLLGLIGIIGLVTEYKAFIGFFGFFAYFRYFTVMPDELFKQNVKNATMPAFFINIIMMALIMVFSILFKSQNLLMLSLPINFAISILIFSILLVYYEFKESYNSN